MFKKLLFVIVFNLSLFGAGAPSLVETTKLIKGEVNPLQDFVGSVNFEKNSTLAAQNSGLVKAINFEIGDSVKKGQILVQIDADILKSQIDAASANLENALNEQKNSKKDYERYKNLLTNKAITQKEYDEALLKFSSSQSNVKALKAKLKELKIQNSKKSIRAPYSGVITEKNVDLGEWVNAGTALLSIVDTNNLEITFNIPINVYNGLKNQNIYDIFVDEKIVKSTLKAAIPSGDKLTRTFPVKFKAKVQKTFVFDGQEAKVSLSKNAKKEALIVPRDAVIKRFGQNVVFFIDDKSTAQMIPVQIVGYMDGKTAIAAKGLVVGMDIVSKGNERVFPKSPVKIINK